MSTGSAATSDKPAEEERIRTADGSRLFCRSWSASHPWATCLIVHGLGEHSGRYERLARDLTAQGVSVRTMDHQGHGRSEGRRGDIRSFSEFIDDLHLLVEKDRGETPDIPRILLGHSLGGLIALNYAVRSPGAIRAVALSSPALGLADPVPPLKEALAKLFARLIPTLPFPNGVDPADISRDPQVVAAYRSDPLVHRVVTARAGVLLQQALAEAPRLSEQLSIPCLIQQGGADRICSVEATQRFAVSIRNAPVTFHRYDGLYHEIFNEPERERVIQDLLRWMRETLR